MKKFLLCSILILSACVEDTSTADNQERIASEQILAEANRQIGMPNLVNFTEKKFAKMIMELRDSELTTWTYLVDMHGKLHFLTESIGYGIPYSTQYTNPEKTVRLYSSTITMPQAEVNGLFMPTSSNATWILAITKDGQVKPIYVEPTIIVSPFELEE